MTDSAVFDDLPIGQHCGDDMATIMREEIEAANRLKKSKYLCRRNTGCG